jgi:hypothetical protein
MLQRGIIAKLVKVSDALMIRGYSLPCSQWTNTGSCLGQVKAAGAVADASVLLKNATERNNRQIGQGIRRTYDSRLFITVFTVKHHWLLSGEVKSHQHFYGVFFMIQFNIIIPSTPRYSKWSLSFMFYMKSLYEDPPRLPFFDTFILVVTFKLKVQILFSSLVSTFRYLTRSKEFVQLGPV